jgi:hypothetical protein
MSSVREWRTLRIYDAAIDFDELTDADGVPLTKVSNGRTVHRLATDVEEFVQTREESLLKLRDAPAPTWFYMEPLSIKQVREYVGRATMVDDRNLRAFEAACVRVDGPAVGGSVTLERTREAGYLLAKDGELDRLLALGLTFADLWEIGAAAYARATVPKGLGAALHVPPSSIVAMEAIKQRSRPAEPSDHE